MFRTTAATFALAAAFLPASIQAQDEIDFGALLETGKQLLEDNEDEIRSALGNVQGKADELREKMVDEEVPTAVYDRLEMESVDDDQLARIQKRAERAVEKEENWATFPVLAALRYQDMLDAGDDELGYGSLHLRCQLDSPESATEAVVTLIEDQVLDDAIRGTRWDIELVRDPDSGVWFPSAASRANLERDR